MLKGTIAINMMGMLVRYVPPEGATVRDALDFTIRQVFGEGKGLHTYPAQASVHGEVLAHDTVLSSIAFSVGDMLNVEFV